MNFPSLRTFSQTAISSACKGACARLRSSSGIIKLSGLGGSDSSFRVMRLISCISCHENPSCPGSDRFVCPVRVLRPQPCVHIRAAGAQGRLPPLVISGNFPLVHAGFYRFFPVFHRSAPGGALAHQKFQDPGHHLLPAFHPVLEAVDSLEGRPAFFRVKILREAFHPLDPLQGALQTGFHFLFDE